MKQEIQQRIDEIKNGIIPKGYKKGKLGIVCANWEEVPFSTLFKSTSVYTDDLGKYPLYSLTIEDGITAKTERYERSHLVKKEEAYKVVQPNDYAYNPMNIRFGAVARHKGSFPVAVSGYYDIFTTVHPEDLLFMDNFLTCNAMITYYNKVSTGSLIEKQRVHFSQFLDFSLPLPPLAERKKIAEILSAQDRIIALYDQKIEQLRLLKKYCLKKMFPKRGSAVPEVRFPGFTDPWERHKLVDVFDFLQNNTLSRADLNPEKGAAKTVHYGDVLVKYGEYLDASETSLPYISSQQIVDVFKSSFLQDGDVIMADTAEDETAGKCAEITGLQGFPTISGLHTIPLRPKKKFASGYLGYYMNSGAYHKQLLPLMQGIKVTSISKSAIQNTEIMFPSDKAEQSAVARYFIQLDTLIAFHQRMQEAEKQKKRAQIQLLIAGIVRII